jgi:gas vesicle protein
MANYDDYPHIVIERHSGGFGAFFWGAVVGAGLALLYAPRSGRETRDELRQGAVRLRDSAEGAVRQVQESVTGSLEDLRREVNERVDAAKDALEAGRRAAHESRADMERRIRETRNAYESRRREPTMADEFDDLGDMTGTIEVEEIITRYDIETEEGEGRGI